MGRPISPHFWARPKKLTQKYTRTFLAQAHLAHTEMGSGRSGPLLLFNLIFVKKNSKF